MPGNRQPPRHRRPPPSRVQTALAALVVLSLLGLAGVLVDHYGRASAAGPGAATAVGRWVVPTPSAGPSTGPASATQPGVSPVISSTAQFPQSGPGTYTFATTTGPVLGLAGPIRHFRVAIESNIAAESMADFTAKIDATLGDPRSWIAGGTYRLQRVPATSPAEFTIYLVTPTTTDRLCAPLPTGGFTSCRQGPRVVLNLARWMTSVKPYTSIGVPLDTYRTYMINHEVGHALGHSHQLCPGPGEPAPVMQQQTLGLQGCTANPWPYVNGKLWTGPPTSRT
jgi:hypothetical protein